MRCRVARCPWLIIAFSSPVSDASCGLGFSGSWGARWPAPAAAAAAEKGEFLSMVMVLMVRCVCCSRTFESSAYVSVVAGVCLYALATMMATILPAGGRI